MNEITSWNYEGAEVRTVQIDGEPWFVLADICRELEISHVKDTAHVSTKMTSVRPRSSTEWGDHKKYGSSTNPVYTP